MYILLTEQEFKEYAKKWEVEKRDIYIQHLLKEILTLSNFKCTYEESEKTCEGCPISPPKLKRLNTTINIGCNLYSKPCPKCQK